MLDAETILRDQGAMETRRSGFEQDWRDIAELMLPRMAEAVKPVMQTAGFTARPSSQLTARVFDETAMLAMGDGKSVFEGEVMPQGSTWQKLAPRDTDLLKSRRTALWYEGLTKKVFALRAAANSGFVLQAGESVGNLLAFGNQSMWPDLLTERPDGRGRAIGIRYASEPIGQLYWREDSRGMIETSQKKFRLTHRQALDKWGENAPEVVLREQRKPTGRNLDAEAEYIHVMTWNRDYDPERIDRLGKAVYSCYLSVSDEQVFDEGGFRTMRRIISRFEKAPLCEYGEGRASLVLPSVRACQNIMRDLVTAIEFMAKPALGASDDMLDQILMYEPGGVTYGAIGPRGDPLIKQLWENPDISPALQLLADTRKLIARAFYQDLYVVREEVKSHVSAFERALRDQQRGILLSPFKRQELEWFTPLLAVELDLMNEMGMLDDMPREVAEAGGLYQVVYDNPLAAAMAASDAAGFYSLLDGIAPVLQLDPGNTVPEFFRMFPFDRLLRGLAGVHRVPVSWQASEDEAAAAGEEAKALADKATLLDVGERAAGIAEKLAGAQGALAPPAAAA